MFCFDRNYNVSLNVCACIFVCVFTWVGMCEGEGERRTNRTLRHSSYMKDLDEMYVPSRNDKKPLSSF